MAKSHLIATVALNSGNFAIKRTDVENAYRDLLAIGYERNLAAESAMDLAIGRGVVAHQTLDDNLFAVATSPYHQQIQFASHINVQLQKKMHEYMV